MTTPFTVEVTVRGYETDMMGHLNQAVYLQYAEHCRWVHLQEAGITQQTLMGAGVGPVVLESTISYRRELLAGDTVTVSNRFEFSKGKTFRFRQEITKADGTLSAEISLLGGVLDLRQRRLVADPEELIRGLASRHELLGF